ncbi:Hypothetical predicted protein [Mytilus galloprovincialis]|uniref:Uncharacterized protein n=1 Tax=Mytilus galloprovincialis TaxID=29158 RepID=A0A8B6CMF7_MYTGA|nr:Hypothetical predicted protein [Mytilus galloprovincialis]
MFTCYFTIGGGNQDPQPVIYKYDVILANVTQSLIKKPNGEVCCVLHGQNIRSIKFILEQRTLYNEHVRFIESVQKNNSGTSETDETMRKHNHLMSCLDHNTNGISEYEKEGKYMCIAQVYLYGRNQTVKKTTTIKIENIQDIPFCVQDTKYQLAILGDYIIITMQFYSKPAYSALSFSKNDRQLKFGDEIVNIRNISLNVYNVTVKVSVYEIIISITEFSEEDVGSYTVNITNEFGSCNCTVQLVSQGNNHTEKVVIGETKRAETTKSLLWYILACGSIIVVLFAMSALRSTFLKTVDTCSKPNIRKPSCHKSTEKQATKKQEAKKTRRPYSDQFMEVTLNELNNGERILIIGQTNEMDASTETNI